MKYLLKNIAQNSLIRTIFLVLVGLFFWIMNLVHSTSISSTLWVLSLVILNSLLFTQLARRVGWTSLPSGFVATSMWLFLSGLSVWQLCWQVHIVALCYIVMCMAFSKMNIQQEAKEQAYLLTLLFCLLSPHIAVTIAAIVYILGYLLARSRFTWKVLLAVLLGVVTYVLYSAIFRYFGWMESLWMEHLPALGWQWWSIGLGAYLLSWLVLYLPIVKPSVASGIIYIIGIIGTITVGIIRFL
jgi:hypothetical protein